MSRSRRLCSLAGSAPLLLIVVACSNPLDQAERRYGAVVNSGTSAVKVCAEGRALADAYLSVGEIARLICPAGTFSLRDT